MSYQITCNICSTVFYDKTISFDDLQNQFNTHSCASTHETISGAIAIISDGVDPQ